jgi:hypothetical protein
MRVLIACECSGIIRDEFLKKGHDAWSCDLQPTERPGPHIQDDVLRHLSDGWDMMICHPPCRFLSKAGARWWEVPGRLGGIWDGGLFALALRDCSIPRIAIENPRGLLKNCWKTPDQVIQPYQFGHPFSKATCLWLLNLPPLIPTKVLTRYKPFLPSNTGGKKRGQKTSRGVAHNAKDASRTFTGIAEAMAEQWGARELPPPWMNLQRDWRASDQVPSD